MYTGRGFARPAYRVVIVYLSPFNSPFPSLIVIFCFPCPTSIAHPITPDQPHIRLSSSLVSIMSIPSVTTPIESLLEVPADINHVKDLFWHLEDLSSLRPTPQQWHNQYFPLLNVYTQRMKHKPNKQGVIRFYYSCCRAPAKDHKTKVPDVERQRNRQQAEKDACGQHFVALQHGNSHMEFQISEEVKNSVHTHDM